MAIIINGNGTLSGVTSGAGKVLQTKVWTIPSTAISTTGSWSWPTTPNRPNTYAVDDFSFSRVSSTSKIIGIATGHIDHNGASGAPSGVFLLSVNNELFGAAYRHQRNSDQEPFHYGFAFEDGCTSHNDNSNPRYYLTCHSSGSAMMFSRMNAGTTPQNPFRIMFWEVEQ